MSRPAVAASAGRQRRPTRWPATPTADRPAGPVSSIDPVTSDPVPRWAATVVLLRDRVVRGAVAGDSGAGGIEVYLLRRPASMAFAAGMYVFPGGALDERDRDAGVPWNGPAPRPWGDGPAGSAQLARALLCAAVRETFEEVGVLIAAPAPHRLDPAALTDAQQRLTRRDADFAEVLRTLGLHLRADLLHPWSRWVTPEGEPRRFDAGFFVAALPAGQEPRPVRGETDGGGWWAPPTALAHHAAGTLPMLPPTLATLAQIGRYRDTAAVLGAAARRDLTPVRPQIVERDGRLTVVLPGEAEPAGGWAPVPPAAGGRRGSGGTT